MMLGLDSTQSMLEIMNGQMGLMLDIKDGHQDVIVTLKYEEIAEDLYAILSILLF